MLFRSVRDGADVGEEVVYVAGENFAVEVWDVAVELSGYDFDDGVQFGWEVCGAGWQVGERGGEDLGGEEVCAGVC